MEKYNKYHESLNIDCCDDKIKPKVKNNCCGGINLPSHDNEIDVILRQLKREVKALLKNTEAKLLCQDKKIAETMVYIKNNLSNKIRNLLDSMLKSGELEEIITDTVFDTVDSLEKKDLQLQNEITEEVNNRQTEDLKLEAKIETEATLRSQSDTNLQTQINSLASGSPLVASSTSQMTNTSRVYVNTTDGKWYYYNGTSWVVGGTYQSTGIGEGTIEENMFSTDLKNVFNEKINDKDYFYQNKSLDLKLTSSNYVNRGIDITNGELANNTSENAYSTPNYIYLPNQANINYELLQNINNLLFYVCFYDENKNFLGTGNYTHIKKHYYKNASYIRITLRNCTSANLNNIKVYYEYLGVDKNISYNLGDNLIDTSKDIKGYYISSNMYGIQPNVQYNTSDFINIENYSSIAISPRIRKILLFDEHYDPITTSYVDEIKFNYIFDKPTGAKYLKITYYANDENSIMVSGSTEILPYTPYRKIIESSAWFNEKMLNYIHNSANITGLKVATIGDSIMAGDGNNGKGIGDILQEKYNINLTDYSVGGAHIYYDNAEGSSTQNIISQAQKIIDDDVNPDLIIIDGLANDLSDNADLGTITSGFSNLNIDNTTFSGGLEYIFNLLKTNYPSAMIVYLRPHNMGSRDYSNQVAFGNRAIDICNKWSVNVCDIFKKSGLNTNLTQMRPFTNNSDRTHPTQEGYDKFYIPLLISSINEII